MIFHNSAELPEGTCFVKSISEFRFQVLSSYWSYFIFGFHHHAVLFFQMACIICTSILERQSQPMCSGPSDCYVQFRHMFPISSRNILKWVPLSVLDEWRFPEQNLTVINCYIISIHFLDKTTALPLERLHLGLIGLWYLWSTSRLVEKWVIHPFPRQTPNSIKLHINI